MLRALFFLFCAMMLSVNGFVAPAMAAPVRLTVYTAVEPDMLKKYAEAFTKQHSDIQLTWVRDSGGAITSRLLAEKEAPKAEAIFGVTLNGILFLKENGLLHPYKPKDFDKISERMRDASPEPYWVGMNAWVTAFCVNTKLLEKDGVPMPQSWADLLKPEYKGKIVMPNPASSSTGFMAVWGWIQIMGKEKAWEYMEKLDKNMKMYVHSGSKPAAMAAQGEVLIGLSSPAFAHFFTGRKAPVQYAIPSEGAAWDMEASALVRQAGSIPEEKQKALAALMDFAASREVSEIAAESMYIPARTDVDSRAEAGSRDTMIDMRAEQSALERDAILQEWRKRFEK